MKICGISDFHGNLLQNIPTCDVLCICGDIFPLNIQRDLNHSKYWFENKFIPWAMKQNCKVLIVPGNHDFYLESLYKKNELTNTNAMIPSNIRILVDELYEYGDITFYGTPWIEPINFQKGKWAFEYTDKSVYSKVPDCDILLSHDSPLHNNIMRNLIKTKHKYWLYGHWHSDASYPQCNWYNCSRLDDNYNFKKNYEYVTFDIMSKETIEQEFLDMLIEDAEQIPNSNKVIIKFLNMYKHKEIENDDKD